VTTAAVFDPVELVQVYTHRWSAQENSLRDFLMSLGLDTNHGYAKRSVENSEVARRRAVLERKLTKARHQAQAARGRRARAEARADKLEKQLKREHAEAARTLAARIQAWEQQGMWEVLQREKREAFQRETAARLAPLQQRKQRQGTPSAQPLPPASGPANGSVTCCGSWKIWQRANERCMNWTTRKTR